MARTVSFHPLSSGAGGMTGGRIASFLWMRYHADIEATAIQNLKANGMQVDGMHIVGQVDEVQTSTDAESKIFGHRRSQCKLFKSMV